MAPSVSLLAAVLVPEKITASLVHATACSAMQFAAGQKISVHISAQVISLATGGLPTMFTTKLKTGIVLVLTLCSLATGAGVAMHRATKEIQPAVNANDEQDGPKGLPVKQARLDQYGDPLPAGGISRIGTVRFNHGGEALQCLGFLPDGKKIVSAGDGLVRFWDAASGQELSQFALPGWSGGAPAIISTDGKSLVFIHQDPEGDTVRVWDLAQGKEVHNSRLPVAPSMFSLQNRSALSPDGKLCAIQALSFDPPLPGPSPRPVDISVIDIATAKELHKISNSDNSIWALTFAGNDRLVTADKKQIIKVWQARTGKLIRQFDHGAPVATLVASADGSRLATLEHNNSLLDGRLDKDVVRVWDLDTDKQMQALASQPKSCVVRLKFSSDSKLLAAGNFSSERGEEATVWEVQTGKRVRFIPGSGGGEIALSPDNSLLAAGWVKFNLLSLETGRTVVLEESKHAYVQSISFVAGGERLLTKGLRSVSIWATATGARLQGFAVQPWIWILNLNDVCPNDRFAVTFDDERGQSLIWDVAAGKLLRSIPLPDDAFHEVGALSHSGDLFAVLCSAKQNKSIHIWNVRTGRKVRSFPTADIKGCDQMVYSVDDKALFVLGQGLVAYEIESGKELISWQHATGKLPVADMPSVVPPGGEDFRIGLTWRALTVSGDGTLVAGIMAAPGVPSPPLKDRIVLCDANTGKMIRKWSDSGPRSFSSIEPIALSPDGRLVASSEGNDVRVWEAATGTPLCKLRGHRGAISALSFSANGKRLASAGWDSTCIIWDLPLSVGLSGLFNAKSTQAEISAWWADLLNTESARAYSAIWRLAAVPNEAVAWIKERITPVTAAQAAEINRHIQDLGNDKFAQRDQATQRLKALGPAAAPALQKALEAKVTLELRRRVEQLLEALDGKPMSGESLRTVRALAVLEYSATPEARRLVQALADGEADNWLTNQAKAVQKRFALQSEP
jgi:WD40 repeat protein